VGGYKNDILQANKRKPNQEEGLFKGKRVQTSLEATSAWEKSCGRVQAKKVGPPGEKGIS